MSTETQVSTGEWKVSSTLSDKHSLAIVNTGEDQHLVCEVVRGENGNTNAKYICTSVNNHQRLLDALKYAKEELFYALESKHGAQQASQNPAYKQAFTAIKAAEAQQ